ncbi:type 2 lanthipeptide synthetase LanM family protein [Streptomyces aidingensis]|uniref:type 2 lanthipeptide synthetase LanM family protein n=1 Tax=Streptomyces aidingensis TaxID=910347 RepID=UPI000D1BE329|nr:type 2 lanthipeptide synthetase LanM family protein [Streptomyces aidingensis]
MTSASVLAGQPPRTSLSPWWWAPGLTLGERLAAPDRPEPVPARDDAPARPAEPRGQRGQHAPAGLHELSRGGLAARLARLGIDDRTLAALCAEPADRLGARAAKPSWAAFTERALAAAPEHPGPGHLAPDPEESAAGPAGAEVFTPALRPLSETAVRAVADQVTGDRSVATGIAGHGESPVDLASVCAGLEFRLRLRLAELAARALVLELDRARGEGLLDGAGPRERFADFLRQVAGRPGLARLFGRYPVLARLLGQTAEGTAEAAAELLTRFRADRKRIVADLLRGHDPGPLVTVETGHGDPHQRGRSTALLRFTDGTVVVYKPRPLDQHVFLARMADWLDGKVPGLGLRVPATVTGDGYGWMEFITHRPCRSVPEVARFHRRQGGLLALFHAVDGVDMHCENIIACGDQPVPIDAETLLHPTVPEATLTRPDPAGTALAGSVQRTCVLPQLLIGEHGAVDISSVGGRPGGTLPTGKAVWDGAGTDRMRLVHRPAPFGGSRNRPLPGDGQAGYADFELALLAGFRSGYDAVVAHREELLGPDGLLAAHGTGTGRVILRATRLYTALLGEMTHPELLRSALAGDALFSALCTESAGDPVRQRLVEEEISDLWSGDVPVFFQRTGDRALWTSRGDRVPDVLPGPSLDAAAAKIGRMSEVDRHDQEWIISAALATTRSDPGAAHRPAPARLPAAPSLAPAPELLLAMACGIADEIVGRAVHGSGRANWLGLELVEESYWTVLPMGAGLAQGYCGVALFLAQLGELTGGHRYRELARAALAALPELLAMLAARPELARAVGPGAQHGLGGICYAVSRLATLLGDGLDRCLPPALTALAHATAGPGPAQTQAGDGAGPRPVLGVAAGLAGGLAAAEAVHREHRLPGAAELAGRIADRLGDRLMDRLTDQLTAPPADRGAVTAPSPPPGFAHGDAGIGWALARHAGRTGRPAPLATTLLRDAVAAGAAGEHPAAWCSGLAGIALAAASAPHLPDPADPADRGDGPLLAADDAARCARLLAGTSPQADLSLCHGEFGVLETLTALGADSPGLARRTGLLLGSLQQHGHGCGTPGRLPSPGLLSGLSGIGYALLRTAFPATVPSVLLLDPSVPPPAAGAPAAPAARPAPDPTET